MVHVAAMLRPRLFDFVDVEFPTTWNTLLLLQLTSMKLRADMSAKYFCGSGAASQETCLHRRGCHFDSFK